MRTFDPFVEYEEKAEKAPHVLVLERALAMEGHNWVHNYEEYTFKTNKKYTTQTGVVLLRILVGRLCDVEYELKGVSPNETNVE